MFFYGVLTIFRCSHALQDGPLPAVNDCRMRHGAACPWCSGALTAPPWTSDRSAPFISPFLPCATAGSRDIGAFTGRVEAMPAAAVLRHSLIKASRAVGCRRTLFVIIYQIPNTMWQSTIAIFIAMCFGGESTEHNPSQATALLHLNGGHC